MHSAIKGTFLHPASGLHIETTVEFTGLTPAHFKVYADSAQNFGFNHTPRSFEYDPLLSFSLLDDGVTQVNING